MFYLFTSERYHKLRLLVFQDNIKPTDVSYPTPRPGKPITDTSAFSAVDFEVMRVSNALNVK